MAFMAKDKIVRTGGDLELRYVTRVAKVTLNSDAGAGGILAWENPEDTAIVVNRILVNITDAAAEVETLDFGSAANATTSSQNLIDNLAANAAGFADNLKDHGTAGKAAATVGIGEYVTGTASGAITSFAGVAYIHYTLA